MLSNILSKTKEKILKNEFNRNVLILSGGTVVAQILPIVISPILTRLYSPEDFGTYAIFFSIVSIVSVISCGRYEFAIMLPEKDEDAINVAALAFIINTTVSLLFFFLILIFKDPILNLLKADSLSFWIYIAPLTIFFMGLFNILNYMNNRFKLYRDISKATIMRSIASSSMQLLMGFLKTGFSGLISGQIISQIVANTKLFYNIQDKGLLKDIKKDIIKVLAKKYSDFPKYSVISALLDIASLQAPLLMISMLFASSTLVGYYSLANRMLQLPSVFIGSSVAQVFYQKFSQFQKDPHKQKELLFSTWKKLFLIGVIPFSVIFFFGVEIFSFIFGNNWSEAGRMASILSPMIFVMFVSSPTSTAYIVFNMQKKVLYLNIFLLVFILLSMYIGYIVGSIYVGIWFMVITQIVWIVSYNTLTLYKLKEKIQLIY
jgi:O-antigen/teichoic acid export membrane protein